LELSAPETARDIGIFSVAEHPAGVGPHREQAVVSCALFGYWPGPDPGAAPSYRHRLGLHAELAYHGDTETASVLVSAHAVGVLLECLLGQRIDGNLISVIGPMPDGVTTVAVLGADPVTWWRLRPERDGRYDLIAADEPWYPVPAEAALTDAAGPSATWAEAGPLDLCAETSVDHLGR